MLHIILQSNNAMGRGEVRTTDNTKQVGGTLFIIIATFTMFFMRWLTAAMKRELRKLSYERKQVTRPLRYFSRLFSTFQDSPKSGVCNAAEDLSFFQQLVLRQHDILQLKTYSLECLHPQPTCATSVRLYIWARIQQTGLLMMIMMKFIVIIRKLLPQCNDLQ